MVARIEKVSGGVATQRAELCAKGANKGKYVCYRQGSNMFPATFVNLDDAADFLQKNAGSGIRMNPGWAKIVDDIYIDGVAR